MSYRLFSRHDGRETVVAMTTQKTCLDMPCDIVYMYIILYVVYNKNLNTIFALLNVVEMLLLILIICVVGYLTMSPIFPNNIALFTDDVTLLSSMYIANS